MVQKQFILFLLCGGIASLANIGSRIVFSYWFGYSVAIIFAFMVGLATGFILFRILVFSNNKDSFKFNVISQIGWYLFVNALGLFQTWGISILLNNVVMPSIGYNFYPETSAHTVGVLVPVITSYIGHKFLTFR